MSIKELYIQIAQSPKIAVPVAMGTTWLGAFLDFIPDDIGKLGLLIGIPLSIILVINHILRMKKLKIEIKILERREQEIIDAAQQRKDEGLDRRNN